MIFPSGIQVYIAIGSVDMRKAINGLSSIVTSKFSLDPFTGNLFVFSNKQKNLIKILYWHVNGFCLWQKRLERGKFHWPSRAEQVANITGRELNWLLDGLNIHEVKSHKKLVYKNIY